MNSVYRWETLTSTLTKSSMQTFLFTLENLYFSLHAHGSTCASFWFCFFSSLFVKCLQSLKLGQGNSRFLDSIKRSLPFAVVALLCNPEVRSGIASHEVLKALLFGSLSRNIYLNHLMQNYLVKENFFVVCFLISRTWDSNTESILLLWDLVVFTSIAGRNWKRCCMKMCGLLLFVQSSDWSEYGL